MRSDAQPGPSSDPRSGADPEARRTAGRVGPVVRALDALTGLFAAGMLVVGVGLTLAQVLAPALLPAAGWGAATGPGWASVLAHLGVGMAGEVVVRARRGRPAPVRVVADAAVIVAVLAVIAWAWWP